MTDPDNEPPFSESPVLARVWRGDWVESQHRGSWVAVNSKGEVLDGAGSVDDPVFARSTVKALQAIPLVEGGAADRHAFQVSELALAVASHNGEACHTEGVRALLDRLGLGPEHLLCGAQTPGDPATRGALFASGEKPSALHNNCSGKHAAFLALALEHDVAPADYLDPESASQTRILEAVAGMAGLSTDRVDRAIDGCNAPTFRLPLTGLARAFARLTAREAAAELSAERARACRRLIDAAAAHPVLVAGTHKRLDTDLLAVTRGRLYPKVGAEAVYVVGVRDADLGLAVKMEDGSWRGMTAVVMGLLERFELLRREEREALAKWRDPVLQNWAGVAVGHMETLV